MSGLDDEALASAVAELYALDRDQFVPARKQAASRLRADGARAEAAAVAKLRHPTAAAWALNQLVRANPEIARRLTELGDQLRAAQASLDAADLRALRPHRDALLDDALRAAATVAAARGTVLGAAADEVRATLVAALADPSAAAAVTSGALTRALSYAGFGEVDLDDALAHLPLPAPRSGRQHTEDRQPEASPGTGGPAADGSDGTAPPRPAAPSTPPVRRPSSRRPPPAPSGDDAALVRARRQVQAVEDDLRSAERAASSAALAAADAARQHEAATRRVAEFRAMLTAAEHDERVAAEQTEVAAADARQADERVAAATAAWSDATTALAGLSATGNGA